MLEKTPRSECKEGLIFFLDNGFGIDTKVFKKITEKEILDSRCFRCGEEATKCAKRDLFLTILPDETTNKQGNPKRGGSVLP